VRHALHVAAAALIVAGCASSHVMLVAPTAELRGSCFAQCEELFGTRPTLTCGEASGAPRRLLCAYDADRWPAPNAPAEKDETCRSECERAGLASADRCWSVRTREGTDAVACPYRVPFH
jgi:hypothetical protein